ncbi:iron-containing alcohol dehydrogenase [Alteribacillus sp. YIM 98480]|uniref:iron-containing alcohol dehydrogenase n=1 Tax=Alteribacillus sp. YIM 98480 TaxID=2606599 RepID=UPI00131CB1F5|nr:iron-containing alcohol dehydrogenase [Alteribacillus sp. YIM 98480]
MLSDFQFHLPTKIIFGYEKISELTNILTNENVKNVFIVTDKGIVNAGILEPIVNQLDAAKMSYHVFDEVEPDPSTDTVNKATAVYKEMECDAIIALGGGSPIDTAKGIRVVASNGGGISDYAGVNRVETFPDIPLIALPTTSGTGSEVTIFAVFSDWEQRRKVTVTSPFLAPTISIVDPKLTISLPPHITAATGIDAFAHGAETYVSRLSQPASEALALSAMRTVNQYLRTAVYNGEDKTARIKLAEASLLAGMAFNQSYLGLTHAIGSAVSGHAHVSHGIVIGLLLPSVMEYNTVAQLDKYSQMGTCFEEDYSYLPKKEAAIKVVEKVTELRNDIGLPQKLTDVGVKKEQLQDIAEDSLKSGMWHFNPRRASKEEIYKLLQEIF